jgi:murein DD-endopeptidase MepM/ murein hydrolase activator NlpD
MKSKLKYWILIFAIGLAFLSGCIKQKENEKTTERQPDQIEEKQITQESQPTKPVSQELVEKYKSYEKLIYEKAAQLRKFEQQQPPSEQMRDYPEDFSGVPTQQMDYPSYLEFKNLLLEFKQFILDNEVVLKDAGIDTVQELRFIEEQLAREEKEVDVQGEIVLYLPFDKENYYNAEVGLWPFCVHGGEHPEGHGGIDFDLRPGTRIKAAADGEVDEIFSEEKGYNILIGHGRIITGYIPVLNPNVKKGDLVKKGQVIGTAGHDSKGKYFIHFEVNDFTKGGRICPYSFFDNETKKLVDKWLKNAVYPEKSREPYICNCEGPIPPA